jgi:K+-transporting ATPase KdpF subunit
MILATKLAGDDIVGAIVSILILAYLAYALIRPEKL